MKKSIYKLLFLLVGFVSFAQKQIEDIKLSPGGYFDKVFDQYGNVYELKDLKVGEDRKIENSLSKSGLITCDSGIFELYFETGSGMDNTSNATENQRRDVVCRVFRDISDFINTPLKNSGNTTKIKIWVRNIGNLQNVPSNALGLATSFYTMPNNTATNFGGIVDGEVYKTIQGGVDSYINTGAPLVNTNGSISTSGIFYHGMMAFNFNNYNWNTNLSANAGVGQHDLYTVVLHEVTHALGFNSLISSNGISIFGNAYKYYTRYDRFLKNNANTQFLLTNTGACSSMYNYGFNSTLSTGILQPNTSNCVTNQTTCANAIRFVGAENVPVYTPNCYEGGSSFSHFEDMCIAAPNTGNDSYFAMSNAVGTGTAFTKRFLKPEERNALIDIGYSLNTTYGNNSLALNSHINYGGTISTGINVAGINDGINNGIYTFTGNAGVQIPISNILANDFNATSFECLQDVFSTATLSATSGTTTTVVNFSSSVMGMHLLRYVPINSAGNRGNITYIYVYVRDVNNCATITACNLIANGNFEQFSQLPSSFGQINRACGWGSVNTNTSPDYHNVNSTSTLVDVPCNFFGSQNDNIGLNGYAGMWIRRRDMDTGGTIPYYESITTRLATPLLPSTTYQLSFDVSLADGVSANAIRFQAYLSPTLIVSAGLGDIPITNANMLFTNPTFSTVTNGWDRITFTFTTDNTAGEQFLYIGGLSNVQFNQITPSSPVQGCSHTNYNSGTGAQNGYTYYYVDNVNLVPVDQAILELPTTVCTNENISNLGAFVSGASSNGVFTGNGVVNNSNLYSFNSNQAGVGTHTITYTYTNTSGCMVSVSDTIQVTSTTANIPTFNPVPPICPGTVLAELPTTSTNATGITGTWSPDLDNTTTTTYTFTPYSGQCAATTTLTITVLPVNDPACGDCLSNLTLSTAEGNSTMVYQFQNWIEANSNYSIASNQDITMKAGDYVYLKPDTFIQGGSLYLGKIQGCDADLDESSLDKTIEIISSEVVKVYPNPTQDLFTINSSETKLKSVEIMSIEGKVIFTKHNLNSNSLEIDFSKYQNGIYIINIATQDNKVVSQKIIKN